MSFFNRRSSKSEQSFAQGATKRKGRRPEGVSRRRRRELSIEPLEDRRVMSAQSPLAQFLGQIGQDVSLNVQSYSTTTAEGRAAILQNELLWQSLMSQQVTGGGARAIPTDPLLNMQWHLINSGQVAGSPDSQPIFAIPGEDINVGSVWNDKIFGNGVVVGVFEPGGAFETDHPDLEANVHEFLEYLAGGTDDHATAVAGLIGAVANNGQGGSGVAPGVTLVPMGGASLFNRQNNVNAFVFAMENGIDIVNNSWGPFDTRTLAAMTPAELLALNDAIQFGRDNKGVIFVWAAGNGGAASYNDGFTDYGVWDTAAYDGYVNSRFTIGVTIVDHDGRYGNSDGTVTSYGEMSSAVLVAAPSGSVFYNIGDDALIGSGIFTTDTTGEGGLNQTGFSTTDRDFVEDINYTSRFNGTSASSPIVSGVVALMLEANPELTWRDVQEILVRSARQNAEFDVPSTVGLGASQNPWIINQMPVFHDPDEFDPLIDPDLQTLFPTLNPNLSDAFNGLHYAPTPQVLTNGAGYTVSQGVSPAGENFGFAHGVVDAGLAVALAKQWHSKGQNLPGEATFTTFATNPQGSDIDLPGAEVGNEASGFQLVPGGLGGDIGFIDYWNEYYAGADAFQDFDDDDVRGGFIEFSVPDDNTMVVDHVELRISAAGDSNAFMDHVRILLVSPNGTHSELNQFWTEPVDDPEILQNATVATISGEPGGTDPDGGNFVWTFSSNRNWGERTDDAIVFDPTTGLPSGDTQGWRLFVENYSQSFFDIDGIELVWHGTPIEAETERIQGLVGIDDNQDDLFNYSRVIQTINNIDGDATTLRYGEVVNSIDLNHESMAANVTVVARRASDGAIVDQFVTGADGNFYFDLVPDNYIISIDDPLDRITLNDTHNNPGTLQEFKTEWRITPEHFRVWQRDANVDVPVDANGVPLPFSTTVVTGMSGINFLLDPGAPPAPQVEFSGVVTADFNGDGLSNGNDVAVPNVKVYADVNRNGVLDSGEIVVTTNANGQYNLVVPATAATVINVGVIAPVNWTPSDPASGVAAIYAEPGNAFTIANGKAVNFEITPPLGTSAGDGSTSAGYLMGVVYDDANNNGSRQAAESGISGIQVFIDGNNNGTREVNEAITTTNGNGAYIFANVAPGVHRVRAITVAPLLPISPGPGVPRIVTLAGGGTVSQIEFGLGLGANPTGNFDFGDLPSIFGITTLAQNGARHGRSAYWLGQPGVTNDFDVDADGKPSADAGKAGTSGDDQIGSDEDGIVVDPLVAGGTGRLVAYASRHGGNLQGWIDFNGDAVFQSSEKVISNQALTAGFNEVFFEIPDTLAAAGSATGGKIFARFRYGEYGINSVTGAAQLGEVEDYLLDVDPSSLPAVIEHGPDFNEDGKVNGRDFLIWQRNNGRTNALGTEGDANGDGVVGYTDLVMWKNYYGTPVGGLSAFTAGDEEEPAAMVVDNSQVSNNLALMSDQMPEEEGQQVAAALIVDVDAVASYGSSVEVSAQASTAVSPVSATLAGAVQLWLESQEEGKTEESALDLEEENVDSLFGDSANLANLALALRSGKNDSSAHRVSDDEWNAESDEENAFELAFAEEADWLQF